MSMEYVTGARGAIETGIQHENGDKDALLVFVEGPYSVVKSVNPANHVPDGYTLETSRTISTGDGGAKMTIRCVNYGEDTASTAPFKTTWKILMAEVTKKLENHPEVVGDRGIILKWLDTPAAERMDREGNWQYKDAEGGHVTIEEEGALKFIAAYNKGIETYVEYYPIIQKITYWKRLPGGSMNGRSTTGGNVSKFSVVGMWDAPELILNGYPNTNFLKSGDEWQENANEVWQRTEEWTFTPDKDEDTEWIYADSFDED